MKNNQSRPDLKTKILKWQEIRPIVDPSNGVIRKEL